MAAKDSNLSKNGTPKSGLPAWLANYTPRGDDMTPRQNFGPRPVPGRPPIQNTGPENIPGRPTGYPAEWGEPPRMATRDMVPLPLGGMGSSTMANWQRQKMAKFGKPKAESSTPMTTPAKPEGIKIGPGGLPPEFRNQGNTAIPADFKPGVIMPTEAERQAMENNPNFINGLPPGMNPVGTQQPNSRPVRERPVYRPEQPPTQTWLGPQQFPGRPPIQNTGPENIPGRPGTVSGTPRPGDPFYSQDWKGNKPPQAGGSQWQNGTVGNNLYFPDGDNPYTPELERPINRPSRPPMSGGDLAISGVSTVTPEFNYTDPKKFKKEMLNLKQDIREAQAEGNTDKLNRLIDKQNRANYTVQALNAGLSQEEAARYAKREADIDAKNKGKGAAAGRIEEPGTVKVPSKAKMEDLQRRANNGDPRAQMEVAKQQPANNFTGKSPYARTTPEESWELEKAAAAGDKRAKAEIATRLQTKDETGNNTLNMTRPALDSLHGLKDTPAQREAAELVKNRQAGVPTISEAEAQRLANGTPDEQARYDALKRNGQLPEQTGRPIADPVNRGPRTADPTNRGPRTADFQDRNRDGIDDRDQGNNRNQGGGGGGGGKEKPEEKKLEPKKPPQEPPGRGGGGGGGGRGNRGPQPRETAKERNARLEAEADRRRDAQYKADERQRAIDEGYSRLDPLGSKKFFEGNKERNEKAKAEADQKRADAKAKRDANAKSPLSNIPKLGNQNNSQPSNYGPDPFMKAVQDQNNDWLKRFTAPANQPSSNSGANQGSPQANNNGWNNGGGMGGGQGGGGSGSVSGSGQSSGTLIGYLKKKKEGLV